MEFRRVLFRSCRILESEGLLVYTQNKGFSLKTLTRQQVLDLVEFRIILEEAAFGAVASMERREAVVEQMHRAYKGIETACETGNPADRKSTRLNSSH